MIIRCLAIAAVAFLVFSAAHAASDENLAAEILGCSAQQDESAQLACYNRIAAQLKAGAAPATPSPVAAAPTPPPAAAAASDFGNETVPFQPDTPAQHDSITAKVANVAYNFFHVFTVTLDNGQIWRQVDGDPGVARFKNDHTEVVTISRGFLDSFHLAIQGAWGDYAVRRIK